MLTGLATAQMTTALSPTLTGFGGHYGIGPALFNAYSTSTSWCSANATGGYSTSDNGNISLEYVFTISLPYSSSASAPTATGSFSYSLSAPLATAAENHKTDGAAHGYSTIDSTSIHSDVVGNGSPDRDTSSAPVSGTSGSASNMTWAPFGGFWVGKLVTVHQDMSTSGVLSHPTPGSKDDFGSGSAQSIASGFTFSVIVTTH